MRRKLRCVSHVKCPRYRWVKGNVGKGFDVTEEGTHGDEEVGVGIPATLVGDVEELADAGLTAEKVWAVLVKRNNKDQLPCRIPTSTQIQAFIRTWRKKQEGDLRIHTTAGLREWVERHAGPTSADAYNALGGDTLFTLNSGFEATTPAVAFTSRHMLGNIVAVANSTDDAEHGYFDGTYRISDQGWVLGTYGVSSVSPDHKTGEAQHQYRPVAYLYAKAETEAAISMLFKGIVTTTHRLLGIRMQPEVVAGDSTYPCLNACTKVLKCKFATCYPHVLRKGLLQKKRLRNQSLSPHLYTFFSVLHNSKTKKQFDAVAAYMVRWLNGRGERRYTRWLKRHYLKPEWRTWYLGYNSVVPPTINHVESYHKSLKHSRLPGKRRSHEVLLNTSFHEMLVLEGEKLGCKVPINRRNAPYPPGMVAAAARMQEDRGFLVYDDVMYAPANPDANLKATPPLVRFYQEGLQGNMKFPDEPLILRDMYYSLAETRRHRDTETGTSDDVANSTYTCDCREFVRGRNCWHCLIFRSQVDGVSLSTLEAPLPRVRKPGRKPLGPHTSSWLSRRRCRQSTRRTTSAVPSSAKAGRLHLSCHLPPKPRKNGPIRRIPSTGTTA
eukprot:GHVU01096575.1.p1 GENE.GHVU01096575.1~~GHVU01096575.1.p1  ORF type:complete len:609 (-),score=71.29 GHVU01096575.1:3214-5040(-)